VQWTIELDDEHCDEIVAAAEQAERAGLTVAGLTTETFALPGMAVCSDLHGALRVFFIGWYVRDAQRHPEVPRLTEAQREAVELLESIANDPAFHLGMDFRPGDIQLLNNAKVLHAREAYDDFDGPTQRRHLLRLWLAARAFTSVEDGLRRRVTPKE
jgi:hypothetical protein